MAALAAKGAVLWAPSSFLAETFVQFALDNNRHSVGAQDGANFHAKSSRTLNGPEWVWQPHCRFYFHIPLHEITKVRDAGGACLTCLLKLHFRLSRPVLTAIECISYCVACSKFQRLSSPKKKKLEPRMKMKKLFLVSLNVGKVCGRILFGKHLAH